MKIELLLSELQKIKKGDNIRVHLAKWAGSSPLDAILDEKEWEEWQKYDREKSSRFPSGVNYILTFAQYSGNKFLFGGIYEIVGKSNNEYIVKKTEYNIELEKRLIIEFLGDNKRGTVFTIDYILNNSKISELLSDKYTHSSFVGIENINHSYEQLKYIFDKEILEWKIPLKNVKGIYLLLDKKTGKKYIGSAKGEEGIWGRWKEYIESCNGGNKKLVELSIENTEYFKKNFIFSILEIVSSNFNIESIELKESKWKEKLNTRGEFGYNSN